MKSLKSRASLCDGIMMSIKNKIHIVFDSNRPVNLYIVKPSKTLYKKTGTAETDYFDEMIVLESKLGGTHYDFYWEVPENRGYVLYYHNPNYGNVTYELKYTDAYYESLDDIIFYSVVIIVLIVIIAVIVYSIKRHNKKKRQKRRSTKRKRYR